MVPTSTGQRHSSQNVEKMGGNRIFTQQYSDFFSSLKRGLTKKLQPQSMLKEHYQGYKVKH